MTNQNKKALEKLERLIDVLADQDATLSDAEIREEAEAEFGSVEAAVSHVDALFEAAIMKAGRQNREKARAAVQASRQGPANSNVVAWPLTRKREVFQSYVTASAGQKTGLALAARNGGEISEADLDAYLENLLELGAIDKEGNPT